MDPLKPADAKPMGREGAAQSSASAAPAVTPAPPAPAAPSRDVSPLIRELGLTEDHAAEPTALVTPGDLLRDEDAPPPQHAFLATGDPEPFARLGRRFLGPEIGSVLRAGAVGAA